jgi:hypothetical protein
MKELKIYRPECYFKNPDTGEEGWDIFFPEVPATSKEEAAKIIKSMPYFDCFIESSFDKFNT